VKKIKSRTATALLSDGSQEIPLFDLWEFYGNSDMIFKAKTYLDAIVDMETRLRGCWISRDGNCCYRTKEEPVVTTKVLIKILAVIAARLAAKKKHPNPKKHR